MELQRYAMAYGIHGFGRTSHIRVNVTRVEGSYVWCRTASLVDAGTPLVLDISQIEWEDEFTDADARHVSGLVAIEAVQ